MSTPINLGKKLAFYYGYPSLVNSSANDVNLAAAVFKDYDMVVWGDGIQDPSHPDHSLSAQIIAHPDMVNTDVGGYIDSTLSLNDIQTKIDQWYDMGVKFYFLDRFGYDFITTNGREHQREIVWCCHEKGDGSLYVMANAWNPDDVFSDAVDPTNNPAGLPTRLGSNDWYLSESFHIINGSYDTNITAFKDKNDKMLNYRTTYGTKMAMTTTNDSSPFDQNKWDNAYYLSVIYELDASSWGEEFFSASSASLPFRTRKEVLGTEFTGPINEVSGVFSRPTNVGVQVDTNTHVATDILN